MRKVREILDGEGIRHLVFKGAHTRELVYDPPVSRPVSDIDLLVLPEDRDPAVRAPRVVASTSARARSLAWLHAPLTASASRLLTACPARAR